VLGRRGEHFAEWRVQVAGQPAQRIEQLAPQHRVVGVEQGVGLAQLALVAGVGRADAAISPINSRRQGHAHAPPDVRFRDAMAGRGR
jgi:hypothetical protein